MVVPYGIDAVVALILGPVVDALRKGVQPGVDRHECASPPLRWGAVPAAHVVPRLRHLAGARRRGRHSRRAAPVAVKLGSSYSGFCALGTPPLDEHPG